MKDGWEPIADDEFIFRRLSIGAIPIWYDPATGELSDQAFAPGKHDTTGISVSRSKYKSAEEAASGRPNKTYYVAKILAGKIREVGMSIEPRPEVPGGIDPAHAEIPELNYLDRKSTKVIEWQRALVGLDPEILGPFETS